MRQTNALQSDLSVRGADAEPASAPVKDLAESSFTDEYGAVISANVFDNIARAVGSATSRRDAFKAMLGGLAGVALMRLGIPTAWAAGTCLCNGQTYDPNTGCCTPTGVVQKHPIANLAQCPNKVPDPTYTCVPNGCGPAGGPSVPNNFGAAQFRPCCNLHDCCYGSCNSDKKACDEDFGLCLFSECATAYPGENIIGFIIREMCVAVEETYRLAVSSLGGDAYDAAQQQACDCCGAQPCVSCNPAGGECGALPPCNGGGDCVCLTTVVGGSACVHGDSLCRVYAGFCPDGFVGVFACCGADQPVLPTCLPLCS
jgi:hypothetical protein